MQYKYRKLTLDQFAVLAVRPVADGDELSFNTEVQFSFDNAASVLTNIMTLTVQTGDAILLKAVMISEFEISPESISEIRGNDGRIEFNPHVLVQFASLNYGAMRGALAVKTVDSPLAGLVVPPVYFQSVITSGFSVAG